MTNVDRGWLRPEYVVHCGMCGTEERLIGEDTRMDAVTEAVERGWYITIPHGWLCSKCYQQDMERLKKHLKVDGHGE